jgi:hypothetical protein
MQIRGPVAQEARQLQNGYIARELDAANEAVKEPQRRRVADFFLRVQRGLRRPVRCFGMPGVRWSFERLLASRLTRSVEFVGVERNFTVLRQGLKSVPGHNILWAEKHYGSGKVLRGFTTTAAQIYWCHAGELMGVRRSDHGGKGEHERWVRRSKNWTCAWLDFSSQIGDEYVFCCKKLESHLNLMVRVVPVAFTFLIGRERAVFTRHKVLAAAAADDYSLGGRVALLRAAWESSRFRDVSVEDAWEYESAGGARVGVLLANFRLKGV